MCPNLVSVLRGNGDGTFQPVVTYNSGGSSPLLVTVADVNQDSKPDVIAANGQGGGVVESYDTGALGLLLGNGDGTFQSPSSFSSGGYYAYSVAVADLNRDGKIDLVASNLCYVPIGNCTNGTVGILINVSASSYKASVQSPINADGSSTFKANRGTVPVKFALTKSDTSTCDLPSATIVLTRTTGGVIGSVDEGTYSMAADNGSNFRIDACQYIYNLAAKSLGVGTYRGDIVINGTVVGNAVFALK
jgi:hypothetical protein